MDGRFNPPEAALRTQLGAAEQVGVEAPYALTPTNPKALSVAVPPDLATFRKGVEAETRAVFLGLAAVSLLIGAIGIGNTSYVAVLERRGEIGLRRWAPCSAWPRACSPASTRPPSPHVSRRSTPYARN